MFLENTVNTKEQFGWMKLSADQCFWEDRRAHSPTKTRSICKTKVHFKPDIDVQYGGDRVVSHDANEILSTPVPTASNIPLLADGCDVVGMMRLNFLMMKS